MCLVEVLREFVKVGFRQEVTYALSFLSIRSPGISNGKGHFKAENKCIGLGVGGGKL